MNNPKICVSIVAENWKKAVQEIHKTEQLGANLFELRMDLMGSFEGLTSIREATKLPLIATNRIKEQGGYYEGDEGQRVNSLLKACDNGFDYVDLELTTRNLSSTIAEIRFRGVKTILSYHDFLKTPPLLNLKEILSQELAYKPDICKIVGTSRTLDDNFTYLTLLQQLQGGRLVSFGMGEMGRLSRILSPLFGGEFTFASMSEGRESAPGQVPIEELIKIYRLLRV